MKGGSTLPKTHHHWLQLILPMSRSREEYGKGHETSIHNHGMSGATLDSVLAPGLRHHLDNPTRRQVQGGGSINAMSLTHRQAGETQGCRIAIEPLLSFLGLSLPLCS